MRIQSITLNGYTAFSVTQIKKFYMETSSPIQVIIGTNGCGKSSLVRECNPLPPARTSFEKGGYKQITLEHEGSVYILSSDFSNTASPQSFVKDGNELNVSGNTKIQDDLIREHLGYISRVHALATGSVNFAEMAPGLRKNLLVDINPYNVDLIVDINKKISSHIRNLTGAIKHLHKRKDELLPKILSDDAIRNLNQDKQIILENIDDLNKCLYSIEPHLQQLKNLQSRHTTAAWNESEIDHAFNTIYEIAHHLYDYTTLPHDVEELTSFIQALELESQVHKTSCSGLMSQIAELSREIDKYEHLLEKKREDSEKSSLENRIQDIRDSLPHYPNEECLNNPLSEKDISEWQIVDKQLSEVLGNLSEYRGNLQSSEVLSRLDIEIISLKDQLSALKRELDNTQKSYDETTRQLEKLEGLGAPENCVNRGCALLTSYMDTYTSRKKQHEYFASELDRIKTNYDHKTKLCDDRTVIREQADRYRPHLGKLKSLIDRYPYIRTALSGSSVSLLEILNDNPYSVHQTVANFVHRSENTHTRRKLESELEILESKYKSCLESEGTSMSMLEELLRDRKTSREKLRDEYDRVMVLYERNTEQLRILKRYRTDIVTSEQLLADANAAIESEQVRYSIRHYTQVYEALTRVKHDQTERLGAITLTLTDQDKLKSRYEEEVVESIAKLEDELARYQKLEQATSPHNGIPHQYMLTVINTLITNINYFIRLVFNYKFEIDLLPADKPIDYKFSATVGDNEVPVSDISTCSSAQKEMINLAFMLASLIQMKATDYPISLDEVGRTFDEYHKQRLLSFLKDMVDNGTIVQLFLINHHAILHEGLQGSEVLVLDDTNVAVPAVYNTHVKIEK